MITQDIERSRIYCLNEIIEYELNSVVIKTIVRKATGNICIIAVDVDEFLSENISPFDTFIQIIDGTANIFIDTKLNILKAGQGIIIPTHISNTIKANQRFKMISTVIKSGYDEILI
jgi:hypothetical protein